MAGAPDPRDTAPARWPAAAATMAERAWPVVALAAAAWVVASAVLFASRPAPRLPGTAPRVLDVRFPDPACDPAPLLRRADDQLLAWPEGPGDGGRTGRCVSEPFELGPEPLLVVQYAGNPDDPGVAAGLALDGSDEIDLPLALGPPARHGFLVGVDELPLRALGRTARLVIDDSSRAPHGFLAVRALLQADGRAAGLAHELPPGPARTMALAALMAALALCYAWRRRTLAAVALVAALTATLFLSVRAFYHWDEYWILDQIAFGSRDPVGLSFWDQFAPLFMRGIAAGFTLARERYAPLQLASLGGHVVAVLLMARMLLRHGISRPVAAAVSLAFAASAANVDVVPWFMEWCFVAVTLLTLVAIERLATGRPEDLVWAAAASVVSPLVWVGGLLTPALALAYVVVFQRRRRRAALVLAVVLVALLAVVLGLGVTRRSVGMTLRRTSLEEIVAYDLTGAFAGGYAALVGARGAPLVAIALTIAAGAVVAWGARRAPVPRSTAATVAFGILWLVASYAMQAVTRARFGVAQSLSLRYTYFAMGGAALVVAPLLDGLGAVLGRAGAAWRRAGAAALFAATVALVAGDAALLLQRAETNEREYFDVNRSYYALTRAALETAWARGTAIPDGRLPQSLTMRHTRRRYAQMVAWVAGDPRLLLAAPRTGVAQGQNAWADLLWE